MQENRKDNSIIKQRILQYLEFKGITKYKFYKEAKVTSGILSQGNGIAEDNLLKFCFYAPDINAEWLLMGRGEMINQDVEPELMPAKTKKASTLPDESNTEILKLRNECYEKGNRIIALLDENAALKRENEEIKNRGQNNKD